MCLIEPIDAFVFDHMDAIYALCAFQLGRYNVVNMMVTDFIDDCALDEVYLRHVGGGGGGFNADCLCLFISHSDLHLNTVTMQGEPLNRE